ncbi:MAG: hypothetical protein IPG90_04745 [Bacteroidetes bacterium]|nr:hypothetical protein [Bacteroidota bacterium]
MKQPTVPHRMGKRWLIKADLKPKPGTDALKYGYYLKTFGHKYLYYKPTGFLSGTFKNVDLDTVSSFKTRVFMKLYYIGLLDKIYQWTRRSGNFVQKAFMKW